MNAESRDSSILVVFFRRPARGVGKQRIAADLGRQRALELSQMLLATTMEDAEGWPGPVVLCPTAADDAGWAEGLLRRPVLIRPQQEGNLGQRLNKVDQELRAAGLDRLIFIGSDAPVLNPAYFSAARKALCDSDVVLGPAADGGVTLMGARHAWPDMRALPWSTDRLADALVKCCGNAGMSISRLNRRYDIDMQDDLVRLARDLARDRRPARRALVGWIRRNLPITAS